MNTTYDTTPLAVKPTDENIIQKHLYPFNGTAIVPLMLAYYVLLLALVLVGWDWHGVAV